MDIVLRGIVVFVFLYMLMRDLGRRELSTFEPFDLILLIILGDAVQQGLTQDDYSLTGAILAVGTIAAMQVFVSYVELPLPAACGRCSTASRSSSSQDGKPIEKNLKRERITIDDLAEQARRSRASRRSRRSTWAVMETSGADQLHQEVRRVTLHLERGRTSPRLLTPADAVATIEACFERHGARRRRRTGRATGCRSSTARSR